MNEKTIVSDLLWRKATSNYSEVQHDWKHPFSCSASAG
jgi:hypothetical protein